MSKNLRLATAIKSLAKLIGDGRYAQVIVAAAMISSFAAAVVSIDNHDVLMGGDIAGGIHSADTRLGLGGASDPQAPSLKRSRQRAKARVAVKKFANQGVGLQPPSKVMLKPSGEPKEKDAVFLPSTLRRGWKQLRRVPSQGTVKPKSSAAPHGVQPATGKPDGVVGVKINVLRDAGLLPKVNLNFASPVQLKSLPAFSEPQVVALSRFLASHYRDTKRPPFTNLEDLLAVPGLHVSPELIGQLSPFITVDGKGPEPTVNQVGFDDGSIIPEEEMNGAHRGDIDRFEEVLQVNFAAEAPRRDLLQFVISEVEGIDAVALRFSAFSTSSTDALQILDAEGNIVAEYGGNLGPFITRAVSGSRLFIKLPRQRDQLEFSVDKLIGFKRKAAPAS